MRNPFRRPTPEEHAEHTEWEHGHCIKKTSHIVMTNPHVLHIMSEMHKSGCSIPKPFFVCAPCREPKERGVLMSDDSANGEDGELEEPLSEEEKEKKRQLFVSGGYIPGEYEVPAALSVSQRNSLLTNDANGTAMAASATADEKHSGAISMQNDEKNEVFRGMGTKVKRGGSLEEEGVKGPVVVMCQDRLYRTKEYKNVMMHELIHAFDNCRSNMDVTKCDHHACTEIRASKLSGECTIGQEMQRLNMGIIGQYQKCVKRRAIMSLKGNPNCADRAEECVNRAWQSCYNDNEPFTKRPY